MSRFHRALKGVLLLKLSIAIGLVAVYFIPSDYAWVVGAITNLTWLFKDPL